MTILICRIYRFCRSARATISECRDKTAFKSITLEKKSEEKYKISQLKP